MTPEEKEWFNKGFSYERELVMQEADARYESILIWLITHFAPDDGKTISIPESNLINIKDKYVAFTRRNPTSLTFDIRVLPNTPSPT